LAFTAADERRQRDGRRRPDILDVDVTQGKAR
jgi:hypothetical protein